MLGVGTGEDGAMSKERKNLMVKVCKECVWCGSDGRGGWLCLYDPPVAHPIPDGRGKVGILGVRVPTEASSRCHHWELDPRQDVGD